MNYLPPPSRLEERCREACEGVRREMREKCERWMVELESGGNVKFTPGDPTQSWFKSCVDLTGSRFSVSDVQVRMTSLLVARA